MSTPREKDVLTRGRRYALFADDAVVDRVARVYWQQDQQVTAWQDLPDKTRQPILDLVGTLVDATFSEMTEAANNADPASAVRAIHAELLSAHEQHRVTDYGQHPKTGPVDLDYRLRLAYRHLLAAEQALSGLAVIEATDDGDTCS